MPESIPSVLGDATQIHQVLMNLCTNAWQAMTDGRGRIEITVATVEAAEVRARVATPLNGAARYVCFAVHDNGAGISPDIVEHIFEPFFTTKPPGEGSGLGLAVAHGIVQSHDGAITVKSDPAEGTTFRIYLPTCEEAPTLPERVRQIATRGAKQHVLYIDDEEPLVFLVVRTLERAGYRCTGEQDATKAIERIRESPDAFDLVVTDLNMPGMSGLDVARELLASNPDLPIIITTGYIRADDVQAARDIGVRDVVLKPDTIEELASLVQTHLARASVSN
jgi:CheY-like chemotaxis protein